MKGRKKTRFCSWITKSGKPRYIKFYSVWTAMKQRCSNKKSPHYKYYGARGIAVCDEWLVFDIFRAWAMANGYQKGLQIDRKDNDGNYEPSNCRWATPKQQANNRRTKVPDNRGTDNGRAKLRESDVLAIRADTRTHKEIAKSYGVCGSTVSQIKTRQRWRHLS